jgi:hypothetical protein
LSLAYSIRDAGAAVQGAGAIHFTAVSAAIRASFTASTRPITSFAV